MPNLNYGELWEQSLRLKTRRLFPRITITKAPSGYLQIIDKRGVKRKAKNIPITWEKENAEAIIDEIYFYLNLHKMTDTETYNTLQTTIHLGGSFYRKLAEAALIADADNKALIFKTWPRLVTQYGPGSTLYSEAR